MRRSSIRLLVQCSFKCRVSLGCELGWFLDSDKNYNNLLPNFGLLGKLWGNPLHPNIYIVALIYQVCMHLNQNKICRLGFSWYSQIPAAPNQSLPDILDL